MAPHALVSAPSGPSESSSVASTVADSVANPFGMAADPDALRGTAYTSAATVVAQAVYAVAGKIFSYEATGSAAALDHNIRLWATHYGRHNAFGVVPYLHHMQARSGALNAILGYFSKHGTGGQPLLVVGTGRTLEYMRPVLAAARAEVPLALSVSLLDFDFESLSLVANYAPALSAARSLLYPVVTAVDAASGVELQHLAVLTQYLAALTGRPAVHLFDGPEAVLQFRRYDGLQGVAELGLLYQRMLSAALDGAANDVSSALSLLNLLAGTLYREFEYLGDASATTVFVVHGTHEATQVARVAGGLSGVGVIRVRVPLPFDVARFVALIPPSARTVVVLAASGSALKADVTAALFLAGRYHTLKLRDFGYAPSFVWTPITVVKVLSEFVEFDPSVVLAAPVVPPLTPITANTLPHGLYLFWGRDNSLLAATAQKLALALTLDASKAVGIRTKFDNSAVGGVFQTQIATDGNSAVDSADVVFIEDESLLASFDIVATARPEATIVLISHKPVGSVEEDFVPRLPVALKRALARNHNRLHVVDFSIVGALDEANDATRGFLADFLTQVAFWQAALPELGAYVVNKLLQANGNGFELLAAVLDKFVAAVVEHEGVKVVKVAPEWADLEEEPKEGNEEEVEEEIPFFPRETLLFANPRNAKIDDEEARVRSVSLLATKLAFSEAHGLKQALRPDLPVKNFVVKVQENRRLTPAEYSRNIFHIEFDTTGTGLAYDIGEALGVHGRNNADEVEQFLQFYGVDGDSLVETSNREDENALETRTARHILREGVDFLGKPPKRFYESLAPYATDPKEKAHLEKLSGPVGAEELKQRQDESFDTYVDILAEFKSARPSFGELVQIISPLKRREYSIALSQKLHPNLVHLLIVVVDWIDPRGRTRYGHCSKYLADLKIGDELVVSVKPSVMKLPPLLTQPIIMSGLGTGLAPFKAFVEEKIWQKQQGMEIGEIYLFMGSRHKKEEYLYGELWEAYRDAGVLTHIGAAFSRDQPEKIYIQDKIRGEIDNLTDSVVLKEGSFYLCGPTWPVPDITACLEDILVNGAKRAGVVIKDVAKEVEEMKENGRYILEVY